MDINTTLVTKYRYDANGNQTLTISPEGNATTFRYDERDLLFQLTSGAITAPSETLSAPSGSYNVRGGIASTTTYNYDQNRNLIEVVDAEDTDQSTGNNSTIAGVGDVTRYIYDGFDREIAVIDRVGNQTRVNYDPAGNIVRERIFGPIGGASPTDNNGTNNVLLTEITYLYDELDRRFQQDRTLFVSNGVTTVRTPDLKDGSLTPNDNKVTMRYEYDRKSRQTFMIEDDRDTYETLYDGADRQIETIDPEGNTVAYAYDDNSNLIETKETDKAQIAGIADEVFLTTYFYDSLNRLQQSVDNIGQAMFYRYDSRNNLVAMADAQGPLDGVISRRFFPDGPRTVNVINSFGNVTRYFYDGINRQTKQEVILTELPEEFAGTSSGGNTATTLNDTSQSFEPGALVGQIVAIADGTGKSQSRQIISNTATQVTLSEAWDTLPDTTSTYFIGGGSAQGDGIHIGASLFGVKDDPTAPESFTPTPDPSQGGGDGIIRTGYTYDDNSLLSALLDDQGNITLYLYDNLDRPITETKGLVTTSPFTEEFILGERRVVTPTAATIDDPSFILDPLIQMQLDKAKARIDEIADLFLPLTDDVHNPPPPPQATTIVYGYDPDSNVLILEEENDTEVFAKYDAINRAIAVRVFRAGQDDSHGGDPIFAPNPVNDFDGPHRGPFPAIIGTNKENYQYDGLSRLTLATDNNEPDLTDDDSTITYAYDSLSRVIEETQQIGNLPAQAISSAYLADTRVGLTYPNGRQLKYTYDGLDRLKTVSDEGAALPIAEYDYIGTYRVLERRYPQNGTRMTYLNAAGDTDVGYDGLRRTVQLRHLRDNDSSIVGFSHIYDRMDNKLTESKLHDAVNSEVYGYDSADRLTSFDCRRRSCRHLRIRRRGHLRHFRRCRRRSCRSCRGYLRHLRRRGRGHLRRRRRSHL